MSQKNENTKLFRSEVLNDKEQGEVLKIFPRYLSWIVCFLAVLALISVIFLFTFEYARRVKVSGRLTYEDGVAKAFAPADGIIVKKFVFEGSKVSVGDRLFAISTDRLSVNSGSTAEGVIKHLSERKNSLIEDKKRLAVVQSRDKIALTKKIEFLKNEVAEIKLQINSQVSLKKVNDDYLTRLKVLSEEGFVANSFLQEKQQANIDVDAKIHSLLREKSSVERDLRDAETTLKDFNDKALTEVNSLDRDISVLNQGVIENEIKREIVVYSKVEGIASSVMAEVGQNVVASEVLGSVIPSNVSMYIQLNVPTSAAGMIFSGQEVLIRYASFPYERFGQFKGTVSFVPQAAMSANELKLKDDTNKDLYYPVKTKLESQFIESGGRRFALREGMLVEADILLESRPLIEWLLDPVFSIQERYKKQN